MEVATAVAAALRGHPSVRAVRLVGSRAEGRSHEFSDWDFVVETDEFSSIADDLPRVFAPLQPLAAQWDPYASHACYMLMFPGPKKVDLLFLHEHRQWSLALSPSPDNLEAIDRHFWDWSMWLEQKRTGGHLAMVETGLGNMFELLLEPMGVSVRPASIGAAIEAYIAARDELERRFGVTISREVEREVRPVVARRLRSAHSA